MAQRRMFSKRITSSTRFLMMPNEAQVLYFHLCLEADDDGVVEVYPVMKMVGVPEDNFKVLVAKGFVKVLNEELVSLILDWKEHNQIRADRKVDSIYKNLLIQVLPDIKLIVPKPRADTKKPTGRPLDNQRTSNGPHRIGKDSIGYKKEIYKEKSLHRGKSQLNPLTEKDLIKIAYELKIPTDAVRRKHDTILDKIKTGEFKNKTVKETLKNWLRGDLDKGWLATLDEISMQAFAITYRRYLE